MTYFSEATTPPQATTSPYVSTRIVNVEEASTSATQLETRGTSAKRTTSAQRSQPPIEDTVSPTPPKVTETPKNSTMLIIGSLKPALSNTTKPSSPAETSKPASESLTTTDTRSEVRVETTAPAAATSSELRRLTQAPLDETTSPTPRLSETQTQTVPPAQTTTPCNSTSHKFGPTTSPTSAREVEELTTTQSRTTVAVESSSEARRANTNTIFITTEHPTSTRIRIDSTTNATRVQIRLTVEF